VSFILMPLPAATIIAESILGAYFLSFVFVMLNNLK